VGLNGIQLSKGMTVAEFKSWIVSTLGGIGSDQYHSVVQSHDGGYVAVGSSSDSQGIYDALIVKYDSNLNVVAQKSLGGSSSDYYYSVVQSHDGGYVTVGFQSSDSQGVYDALIVKYDSNLNVVTQKSLNGSERDIYLSIVQSHDGGYVAVGYQESDSQGVYDALIVKYDNNLNVMAQKSLGGSGTDYCRSIIQSNDNGYITVGYQNSDSLGDYDSIIIKLPNDFTLIDEGVLINHSNLYWSSTNITTTTPNLFDTWTSLIETTPTLNEIITTLTDSTSTLTEKRSEKP